MRRCLILVFLLLLAMPVVGLARPEAATRQTMAVSEIEASPTAVASRVAAASPADGDSLATVKGRVYFDTHTQYLVNGMMRDGLGIPGANVRLYYLKEGALDSLYTTTARDGLFIFRNVKPQRIALRISSMGMQEINGVYDIAAGENMFFFSVKRRVDTLDAAKVTAQVPLIRQLQDTTYYNTGLIQAEEGEKLREVLKMLPGFEVSDDAIKVDGEKVSRTYVNGTLVFGDKVTTAIDVLKADEVRQVKVYDELSDIDKHRGVKNAKKNRVLDIITKDGVLSVTVAEAGAAGGADCTGQPRYAAAGLVGFHSEMLQLQAQASANNIQTRATYMPSVAPLLSQVGPLDSYSESIQLHLEGNKYWKDRYYGNSIRSYYDLDKTYTRSASTALKEYYESDAVPSMNVLDTATSRSNSVTHKAMVALSLKDTPLKSFDISTTGSITTNSSNRFQGNLTQTPGMIDTRIHQDSGGKGNDYSLDADVTWTNNDSGKWRPMIRLSGGLSNRQNLSWTVDTLSTSYLRRKLSSDAFGRSANANFTASLERRLVNSDTRTVNLNLNFSSFYNHSLQKQLSVDEFEVATPVMDMANSYDYTTNNLTNSIGAYLTWNTSKSLFAALASFNDAVLFYDERMPVDFGCTKHFPSVQAQIVFGTKASHIGTLYFSMLTMAITPSIEQIRNRISDANPLSLTAGNPGLKQAQKVSLTLSDNLNPKGGVLKDASFQFELRGDVLFRPIVSRVRYFTEETVLDQWDGYVAKAGSMLNTFDNSRQPRIDLSATASISRAFNKILNLKLGLEEHYLRNPMYNGDAITAMDELSSKGTFSVQYRPSKKFMVTNLATSSYIVSSRQGELLSSRWRLYDSFNASWSIIDGLKLVCGYNFTGYVYTAGSGADHFHHYLDAGITKKFLKDKSLSVELWGHDLLNSGSIYTTEINSAMMSQTWTPTYGRNIMLKVVYSFRKKQ